MAAQFIALLTDEWRRCTAHAADLAERLAVGPRSVGVSLTQPVPLNAVSAAFENAQILQVHHIPIGVRGGAGLRVEDLTRPPARYRNRLLRTTLAQVEIIRRTETNEVAREGEANRLKVVSRRRFWLTTRKQEHSRDPEE